MKNPWVIYVSIRLGLFAVLLAIMLLVGFDPNFSTLIAGVVALALSLIFFDKQRSELSKSIYEKNQRKHADRDTRAEDDK